MTTLEATYLEKVHGECADAFDGVISKFWKDGLDTVDIAKLALLPEHRVANRLAFLRDAGKL